MEDPHFEGAFRDLFPKAVRLAYRILGERSASEDVAAEALARAYASWRKLRDVPHLEAWVMRVATNLALDLVKRRKVVLEPRQPADPEDAVALRSALYEALVSLPRGQREVIALRHLAGLSERETAEALGISVGAVKTQAHRAAARMRERLGSDFGRENADVE